MGLKVKICGTTRYEDAAVALDYGADAVGFIFYDRSPRHIAPADAFEIVRKLPPFAVKVGVFVNEFDLDVVRSIAQMCSLNVIQLHGGEGPEYCAQLPEWPVVKALRVNDGFDPNHAKNFSVSAILLDAYDADTYGGTGRLFDWRVAIATKQHNRVILAGGLRPENVGFAIKMVKPYGIDVCSGVEAKPGQKDKHLIKAFMEQVDRSRADSTSGPLGEQVSEWFTV
jgi:phosphoribosylanthranilate isomerase